MEKLLSKIYDSLILFKFKYWPFWLHVSQSAILVFNCASINPMYKSIYKYSIIIFFSFFNLFFFLFILLSKFFFAHR